MRSDTCQVGGLRPRNLAGTAKQHLVVLGGRPTCVLSNTAHLTWKLVQMPTQPSRGRMAPPTTEAGCGACRNQAPGVRVAGTLCPQLGFLVCLSGDGSTGIAGLLGK